jgi:hypothetical protein
MSNAEWPFSGALLSPSQLPLRVDSSTSWHAREARRREAALLRIYNQDQIGDAEQGMQQAKTG